MRRPVTCRCTAATRSAGTARPSPRCQRGDQVRAHPQAAKHEALGIALGLGLLYLGYLRVFKWDQNQRLPYLGLWVISLFPEQYHPQAQVGSHLAGFVPT